MKSDREFIDGIYAKADMRKSQKTSFFQYRKRQVLPIAAASAVLLIVGGIGSVSMKQFMDKPMNTRSSESQENARVRTASMDFYVEGKVIEVLEPYMGYDRIRIKLDSGETMLVAYSEAVDGYREGDFIKATLIQRQLGTQEYYIIAD